MTSTDVVADHRAAGRAFTAAGLTGFVREAGDGETVLCMHGVPTSSFLYRKVLDELAARNVRCVAFDLPGLGLADRPENFDYTWTGLGQYSVAAIDALELQRFHLVVHDVGGPVGFELAAAVPDRVKSLTVLNTIVDVDTFKPFRTVTYLAMTPALALVEGDRAAVALAGARVQHLDSGSATDQLAVAVS